MNIIKEEKNTFAIVAKRKRTDNYLIILVAYLSRSDRLDLVDRLRSVRDTASNSNSNRNNISKRVQFFPFRPVKWLSLVFYVRTATLETVGYFSKNF